ncbi:MAG: hypothetical protein Q8T08_07010 [Ignavibacteria bacterium]|nr:hypothetical protein [Ignavibacteria bacterium]
MNTDEFNLRIKELEVLEEAFKIERDFESLIKVYGESLDIYDSVGNYIDKIPKKAYCLARLGRKDEARIVLQELRPLSYFTNQDDLIRAFILISIFLDSEVSNISIPQKNMIINWLENPNSFDQVSRIVFDYADIISI